MMNGEQREQLLRQVAFGVALEATVKVLGISAVDLRTSLLCDEELDISLALAQGMRTESAKALFRELVSV